LGNDSWKTWAAVFVLIIFAGVASAAWPFISDQLAGESRPGPKLEQELITIKVEDYVLGNDLLAIDFVRENVDGLQFTQLQGVAVLLGVVLILTGAAGLPLALLFGRLDTQVQKTYSSDGYQEARNHLIEKEQERIDALRRDHPDAKPTGTESRWPTISTAFVIIIFVWLFGTALGKELYGESRVLMAGRLVDPTSLLNLALVLIAAVTLYVVFRRRRVAELESTESEYQPVDWGTIWVILSGMLIVGVGTGLALALRG
jgi:hypothetical protein